jgi:hypothetical protein
VVVENLQEAGEGVVRVHPVENAVEAAVQILVLEVHLHNMADVEGGRQGEDDIPHDQQEVEGLHLASWVVVDQVVQEAEG